MTAERSFVWLDGRLVPSDAPHLEVGDRAFQLGDGLFETLRARRGVPIDWAEHRDRLFSGAAAMQFNVALDGDGLRRGLADVLDANGLSSQGSETGDVGDAAVRITVSRGTLTGRGTLPDDWLSATATVVIQAWPYRPPRPEQLERGLRLIVSTVRHDPDSPLAGIKTTSRADHVFARLEAERAGVDDALFLTPAGDIAEATSANVFAIDGDRLVTPPAGRGILPGATRTWVLTSTVVADLGLVPEERDLTPDDLVAADEAFLSSSVAGLLPVVELDGQAIGGGVPCSRTIALREARERWVDEQSLSLTASRA